MTNGRIIRYARRHPTGRLIRILERHLLAGGVAILPTETQYALAAIATSKRNVARVRTIKGRSHKLPFSVFLPDHQSLRRWHVDLPESAELLAEAFWPGPMTLILPTRHPALRRLGGGATVGIRVSPEPLIEKLCRRLGTPLLATSANPSGLVLSARAENHWLSSQVEVHGMIWARPARYKRHVTSTVLDCTRPRIRVVRPGAIPERIWWQALPSDTIERMR
ncbi:MAG: threonylcarbamoyl-AMP synthase [candidate division Zixibacteria bacterium]|nr:threonylcarbamoyl-AMP synthase [candidate division Zixibacteria bacterium]